MILKLLKIIYSKSAKITLSVCVAVGKFVCDVNGGKLTVLPLCMFKPVRLLNRSWFILERSHVFSLRAVEKDLSPAALLAGFTRVSLHNVITSFIISRSGKFFLAREFSLVISVHSWRDSFYFSVKLHHKMI